MVSVNQHVTHTFLKSTQTSSFLCSEQIHFGKAIVNDADDKQAIDQL